MTLPKSQTVVAEPASERSALDSAQCSASGVTPPPPPKWEREGGRKGGRRQSLGSVFIALFM